MEAIVLGSVALGMIAWAWWSERVEKAPHGADLVERSLALPEEQVRIGQPEPMHVKGDIEMRRKSNMYSREGKKLNSLLAQYSTGCEIHRGRKVDRTPKTVVYYLAKGRGFTLGKLQASIEAIETDLYAQRELAGYDDDFSMLLMKQPLSLIAPRVDPVTLTWDKRKGKIDPCHMLVGLCLSSGKPKNLTLDLNSPTQFSSLVGGSSGCGKSILLDGMVLSVCEASNPNEFELMIVDVGKKHFSEFEQLPHCTAFAHTVDSAKELLQHVESKMSGPEDNYQKRTAIVIDEIQSLTKCGLDREEKEFKRLLIMIASKGRAYGFSIIIATQKPEAGIIPTNVRANCVTRIAGRCLEAPQSEMILGNKRTEATDLSGVGSFLVDNGSSVQIAYSYMLDKTEIIEEICFKYRSYQKDFLEFGSTNESEAASLDSIPDEVIEVFEACTDENGKPKRFKTKAIKAYAQAVGKSPGGDNHAKFGVIVEAMAKVYADSAIALPVQHKRNGTTGKVIKFSNYR